MIALVKTYINSRPLQSGGFDQLAASDKSGKGPRGTVDVDDEMLTLVKFADGATGSIEATRNAYGRNNFITFEIHGDKGSIAFNYERMDELQVMFADDPDDARGFRIVYTGPAHPYGGALWPIPALRNRLRRDENHRVSRLCQRHREGRSAPRPTSTTAGASPRSPTRS